MIGVFVNGECRGTGLIGEEFTIWRQENEETVQICYYSSANAGIYTLKTPVTLNDETYHVININFNSCACSNDDNDTQLQAAPAPVRKISIEVIEDTMDTKGIVDTRGSVINTSSLTAFSMNYHATKYVLSKNNNVWTPDPIEWPYEVADDTPIPFHAYNGGEYQYPGDYISFTIDENADKHKDLLVATDTVSYSANNGKVSLAFDHACAAVDLQICITTTLRNALGTDLTIDGVTLVNVKNHGNYYYSTGWSDISGSTYYTLTTSSFSLGTELQTFNCGTLFLIPQTFGEGTGLSIDYTVNGNQKNTFVSMKGYQLEAGNRYTPNIRLGTSYIKLN
jgi:hypothetical protein